MKGVCAMKRLLALLLIFLALLPICAAQAQTLSLVYEDGQASLYLQQVDEETEEKIDLYMEEFDLPEECKAVIINYLPDLNNLDRIEQDGMISYSIFMEDGTKYLLSLTMDGEPACLQSSEKDYKSRIRYYDKFAK